MEDYRLVIEYFNDDSLYEPALLFSNSFGEQNKYEVSSLNTLRIISRYMRRYNPMVIIPLSDIKKPKHGMIMRDIYLLRPNMLEGVDCITDSVLVNLKCIKECLPKTTDMIDSIGVVELLSDPDFIESQYISKGLMLVGYIYTEDSYLNTIDL